MELMKIREPKIAPLLVCIGCAVGHQALAAEKVLVYGAALSQSSAVMSSLRQKQLQVVPVDDARLKRLTPAEARLLVLAGGRPLSSQSRRAISRFLQTGGNAIVVGTHNFQGDPQPVKPVALGDFAQEKTYEIIRFTREERSGGEEPRIAKTTAPNGAAALRLNTTQREMSNVKVQFSAVSQRNTRRKVLTFQAKGDAYMDLLALEATNTSGQKYFAFVPLSQRWEHYAISLADFIPEGWQDAQKPYPLLSPETLQTIALGTNHLTLWPEKPMDFSLASVCLAENASGEYAPTPALNRLKIPFQSIGITAPDWIFDPLYRSQSLPSQTVNRADKSGFSSGTPGDFKAPTWRLSPPYSDFPGVKLGTDNLKAFDTRPAHDMRRIPLWQVGNETVAERRLHSGGIYAGASVALYGLTPQQVSAEGGLCDSVAQNADYILHRPKIARVEINTTRQTGDSEIVPLLKITLQNPLGKSVQGQLQAQVAGKMRGKADFALKPHQLETFAVQLNAVPANFDFTRFDWQVALLSASGQDQWRDTVDVERILLNAATHMVAAQKIYPDGRISNTYFSDVYGARAMLAYWNFLQRHPEHLKRNLDLWRDVSPEAMRQSVLRLGDMIVRRQNPNGSVPMGYAEPTNGFNVADGGQISLGMALLANGVNDANRERNYLQSARKIIDFAETFYIDEALFAKLQREDPEQLQKDKATVGYYGLGVYAGGKRKPSGPLWVLADLLATQALLSYEYPEGPYQKIFERNVRVFLDHARDEEGWYQAEAMMWSWLSLPNPELRARLSQTFDRAFLRQMYKGREDEMYNAGSRGSLRALPLVYSRRILGDSPNQRAALLKYVWSAGAESSGGSVRRLAEAYPNPHHGASIAAMKFAEFSSIWAMELMEPNSTLLQKANFPRVKPEPKH